MLPYSRSKMAGISLPCCFGYRILQEVCFMSIFTGAGVALVTPTHADGSVNYEKMKEAV